ncbi:DUF5518 domain-containing protein [Halogeometricum limi]|uniref:DUF5518 domain-containing protein n=1 Tax=Halogeometricum limi TaxID=555875 RepID=A0A1I6HBE3_9EURY|nr:DUF5518 domain-containing protein [Halogeometricum limi]SFR51670.1 hypothetical protein SAMN04488124_2006 [Halogeometricum limi]
MDTESSETKTRTELRFWPSALLGAVVSVVTSFVPLSPVLGGGVAGYLYGRSRTEGLRVGAASGVLAAIPVVVVVALLFGGLSLFTIVEDAAGAAALFVGLFLVATGVVVVLVAGLSALGGYLGAYVRETSGGGDNARREGAGRREKEPDVDPTI